VSVTNTISSSEHLLIRSVFHYVFFPFHFFLSSLSLSSLFFLSFFFFFPFYFYIFPKSNDLGVIIEEFDKYYGCFIKLFFPASGRKLCFSDL